MQIGEPERAVAALERALQASPKDVQLMSKIAAALVTSHDYQRAIDFYRKAIRSAGREGVPLQHELAHLLVRLRMWPEATALLNGCLESSSAEGAAATVETLSRDVDAWLMIAKVHK